MILLHKTGVWQIGFVAVNLDYDGRKKRMPLDFLDAAWPFFN